MDRISTAVYDPINCRLLIGPHGFVSRPPHYMFALQHLVRAYKCRTMCWTQQTETIMAVPPPLNPRNPGNCSSKGKKKKKVRYIFFGRNPLRENQFKLIGRFALKTIMERKNSSSQDRGWLRF